MTINRVLRACALTTASITLTGCGFLNVGAPLSPAVLTVTSSAFSQDVLPPSFTCHANGTPVSPPVRWSGGPPGTAGYAMVIDDSSAPITPYVYWIVYDIAPGTTDIEEGTLPPGARTAPNSTGHRAYDPPCPHSGSHQYRVTVYALSKQPDVPSGAGLREVLRAIAQVTVGRGRRVVTAHS